MPNNKVDLKSQKVALGLIDQLQYDYDSIEDQGGLLSYLAYEWHEEKFEEYRQAWMTLNDEYKHTIPTAVQFSKNQIGVDYDEVFILDNDKYYCSELIYEAFLNDSIFELKPMTFFHPKTKKTLKVWKEYYSDLNTNIPEGNPGINPGIMSLSNKIEMVHFYGIPDGLNN